MKVSFVAAAGAALALLPLISAHEQPQARHARPLNKRQGPGSATSRATRTSTRPASASSAPAIPLTRTVTDIPALSAIPSGTPVVPTIPVSTTYAPGATPSGIPGAPALPEFSYVVAEWPTPDQLPDTSSPEVKEWLEEIAGVDLPDFGPTVDGSCGGDPVAFAAAAERGWWTCGGHTRPGDIVDCPDKLTFGSSFDDGPSPETPRLLKYLDEKDIKTTFFVVGSRIVYHPDILRDEYMTGHEISVHTWSHRALTTLSNEQIVAELGWTRKAIQDVLGVTPTTMRPPFGDIDDRVRAISMAMGLQPIMWTSGPTGETFDSNDWKIPGGTVKASDSVAAFQSILGNSTLIDTGFIVLEHDLFPQEVDLAIGYLLEAAINFTPKLTIEPIGTCQGWPAGNLYLETTTNATFPYPDSPAASQATVTSGPRASAINESTKGGGSNGSSGASGKSNGSVRVAVAGVVGLMGAVIGGLMVLL